MYLIDTNIVLELLLEHEKANECADFLIKIPVENFCISEFSLYSIGIILLRHKMHNAFLDFIKDFFLEGGVRILKLDVEDMEKITEVSQQFNLDFDDAYQYVLAKKYELAIVSYDKDFDRTDIKRKTPKEVITE